MSVLIGVSVVVGIALVIVVDRKVIPVVQTKVLELVSKIKSKV